MAGAAGLALVGRNVETLNATAEKVKAITESAIVSVHSTDITSESEVKTLYEKIGTQLGGADVLINNAATMNSGNTGDIEPALWWQDFVSCASSEEETVFGARSDQNTQESNVKGPYLLSHYFIKHFSDKGTIINLASFLMGLVMPGTSSYAASKLAMTKTSEFLQSGKIKSTLKRKIYGAANSRRSQNTLIFASSAACLESSKAKSYCPRHAPLR